MIYHLKGCYDCGEIAKTEYCWSCNHEGCRECIRPVIGPDLEVWYVCDMCKEGIQAITQEIQEKEIAWDPIGDML